MSALPSWDPQNVVDAEQATELIQGQFPELLLNRIEPLGAGWDNTAYLVNESYVFRFPRRDVAVPLMELEMKALPEIAKRVPLKVPQLKWFGKPTQHYQWPFAGYQMIDGITACGLNLSEQERATMAPILATFLKALHSIPEAKGLSLGLSHDPMKKLNTDKRIPMTRALLDRLKERKLLPHLKPYRALLRDCQGITDNTPFSVVHGDFYVRHLIVDSTRTVCGVIDWGDVHVGNPAVDLSILHTFLPPSSHDEFMSIYGPISDSAWMLSKLRALFYGCVLLDYGVAQNDERLIAEARFMLKNVVD